MSFLDDLRKEAESVKQQENEEYSSTLARNAMTLRGMLPRLKAMYKYMNQFADSLKVVQPTVAVSYEVPGFVTLENLMQTNYRVFTDDPRQLTKFTFAFNCEGQGTVQLTTKGTDRYSTVKEYLWSHNLRFTSKLAAKGEGVFYLESMVPVSFEFFADVDKASIRLRVKNMEGLGTSTYTYNPDKINKEYMDEVARYAIRRPNKFDDLSGNRLSEDIRRKLREEVDRQRRERDRELTMPRGEPMPKMSREPKAKKRGLLTGLFARKRS